MPQMLLEIDDWDGNIQRRLVNYPDGMARNNAADLAFIEWAILSEGLPTWEDTLLSAPCSPSENPNDFVTWYIETWCSHGIGFDYYEFDTSNAITVEVK